MLWNDMEEMKSALFKILGCNVIMMIGAAALAVALDKDYGLWAGVLLSVIILGALAGVVLFIRYYMREFHVTVKQIRIPLCMMMIPSILLCLCRAGSPFVLICFLMGMYVLMMIWAHRQMKSLPMVLKNMDLQMEEKCPGIFRNDISRISDREFLAHMSDALDQVPEEKITAQLQEAVSDWYSVYICLALMLEGTFAGMCVNIWFVYL